jgi:hypothetical protein
MDARLHVVTEDEECRDLLDSKSLAKACRRAHWRVIEDIEVLIAQSATIAKEFRLVRVRVSGAQLDLPGIPVLVEPVYLMTFAGMGLLVARWPGEVAAKISVAFTSYLFDGIKALPPGERWRMNNQFWALFSEPLEDA